MDNGITLTTNGRSWVSVANPLRHDTVAKLAQAQDKYDTSQVSTRSGAVAVAAGAAVGLLAVLVGLPALLAVVCGLVALPAAWLLMFRRLRSRAAAFESTLAANTEDLGPRRIVRGEFLPGECADAADQLVIGSVQILQSTAYRCGALGETSFVYDDILESTWSLLHRLRAYEREVRDMARMQERASDEHTRSELAVLADRMDTCGPNSCCHWLAPTGSWSGQSQTSTGSWTPLTPGITASSWLRLRTLPVRPATTWMR